MKKEKPGRDDSPQMADFLFKRNKSAGQRFEMDGQPESGKAGHKCSACNLFYFESENMIDEFGVCKNCREGLEVLEKEEKKSKAIP